VCGVRRFEGRCVVCVCERAAGSGACVGVVCAYASVCVCFFTFNCDSGAVEVCRCGVCVCVFVCLESLDVD